MFSYILFYIKIYPNFLILMFYCCWLTFCMLFLCLFTAIFSSPVTESILWLEVNHWWWGQWAPNLHMNIKNCKDLTICVTQHCNVTGTFLFIPNYSTSESNRCWNKEQQCKRSLAIQYTTLSNVLWQDKNPSISWTTKIFLILQIMGTTLKCLYDHTKMHQTEQ